MTHTRAAGLAPTGRLRAVVNLGNPVLAHGTADEPAGVTVDLARALAERLGVPLDLHCVGAARDSLAALVGGRADLGFLAIEPERERQVRFSPSYLAIEGVYVVPPDSPIGSPAEVDRPGVRVGVKRGSAYDLFLTRTLAHAQVVRGEEGVDVLVDLDLDVGAGIAAPVRAWVGTHPGHRVLEPAFMQIRQALAVPADRDDAAVAELVDFVRALVDAGFVADRVG